MAESETAMSTTPAQLAGESAPGARGYPEMLMSVTAAATSDSNFGFTHRAAVLVEAVDELLRASVIADRAHGRSWEQIGAELGVTRSTAHGRFGDAARAWKDEGGDPVAAMRDLAKAFGQASELMKMLGERGGIAPQALDAGYDYAMTTSDGTVLHVQVKNHRRQAQRQGPQPTSGTEMSQLEQDMIKALSEKTSEVVSEVVRRHLHANCEAC